MVIVVCLYGEQHLSTNYIVFYLKVAAFNGRSTFLFIPELSPASASSFSLLITATLN
jgi:hypothetical protein